MQIKEIDEFKNHLKYQLNYSDKTISSYEDDIENFYLFIFAEGVDIDEGDGTRIDLSFFVETLSEVKEPVKKAEATAKKKPVKHTVILGEDDEEYEAPEVELDSFVPSKKRTFKNKNTKWYLYEKYRSII